MSINDSLSYSVLERTSNDSFQALCVEFYLHKQSNVICRVNIIFLMSVLKLTLPDEAFKRYNNSNALTWALVLSL